MMWLLLTWIISALATEECNDVLLTRHKHLDTYEGSVDKESQLKYKHYSFKILIISNKLGIILHDNKTKHMYQGLFDKNELENCGFGSKQTENVNNVFNFIESAIIGHDKITLDITRHTSHAGHIKQIKIAKQDDHFPQHISIKLIEIPRDKSDILEEQMMDLQNKNAELRIEIQRLQDQINTHGMPKGSIVMWSGSENDISDGWALCDGKHGTPDLRNRFIIGAADKYSVNSTGGTEKHNHQVKDNTGMGYGKFKGSSNIRQAHGSHQITSSEASHLPPYYALCFIMKIV